MSKPPKIPAWVTVASVIGVLWLVNYGLVQLGMRPYFYCWGMLIAPVFEGWFQFVKLGCLVWFAWLAYTKAYWQGIWAILAITLVFGVPVFFDTAFRLGGSCH